MHSRTRSIAPAIIKLLTVALTVGPILLASNGALAAQIFKCNLNGTIHYQQSPCKANQPRERPTVEELNAERQRQWAQSKEQPNGPKLHARPIVLAEPGDDTATKATSSQRSSFKCDIRKYCTQMTSCAEAKYFSSKCAGVKMDGDGDGIPCEDQFCGH
jgi:hypothetical protein